MKNKTLPLNLQYFAKSTDDGTGADDGNGGGVDVDGAGADDGQDDGKDGNEPTFDDLLKGGHQAEFDRRVQKAIDTALTKQKTKYEALMNDKLSEAEKLAKMNKEEKQEYMQKKHEKELEEIEQEIKNQTNISEDRKKKIIKTIFQNIVIAIAIIFYFIFINLGYCNINETKYLVDLKVFSVISIGITILLFEKA